MAVRYSPDNVPPSKPTVRTPGELLWEFHKDFVAWSAEVKFLSESYGWQALIMRDGELVISQRFALKQIAIEWADLERAYLEKGRME